MPNIDASFNEYERSHREMQQEADRSLNQWSTLPVIERFAIRVAYLVENSIDGVESRAAQAVLARVFSKLTNEIFAFVGALRACSLHGAYHHVRAVSELEPLVYHMLHDTTQMERRFRQFREFERVYLWVRNSQVEEAREVGGQSRRSAPGKDAAGHDDVADVTPERIQEWQALFGTKSERQLRAKMQWHEGSLKDLFFVMDPSGQAYRWYEWLCHTTHVSPLAYRYIGHSGPRLIGYERDLVQNACWLMFTYSLKTLNLIDERFALGLLHGVEPDMDAFIEHSEKTQLRPVTSLLAKQQQPKLGRNSLCHCGSGKKFKKCHGASS